MRLFNRGRVWYAQVYENRRRVQRPTQCHDRRAAEVRARQLERDAADPAHAATARATLADALQLLAPAACRRRRSRSLSRSPGLIEVPLHDPLGATHRVVERHALREEPGDRGREPAAGPARRGPPRDGLAGRGRPGPAAESKH
jgi:hypothetical protein